METTTLSRLPPDGHEFGSSQEDHCGLRPRTRSGLGWRRDERSEKSVRDKIALFTNDSRSTNHRKTHIIPSNENENKSVGKSLSYSVDNLAVNSSPKFAAKLPVSSTRTEPRVATHKQQDHSLLNERSRSLLDVTKTKRNSLMQQRKDSFIAEVADQKRKSISKLRGLVIPANSEVKPQKAIVDLPEIISKDSVLIHGKVNLSLTRSDPLRTSQNNVNVATQDEPEFQKKSTITFQSWKTSTSSPTTTIPKYSPAFKRKELTLATSQQQQQKEEHHSSPMRPEETSSSGSAAEEFRRQQEEASDTDSAVSSSRSSFSPSGSPVPSADKDDDPGDESGPRVFKPQTVEALNRKNVLQSARFSCGGTEHPDLEPQVLADPSGPLPRPAKLGPENPTLADEIPNTSPSNLSPIRSRKGSMDFEQILKRFSDAEKPDRSPSRNRKLTSESITYTEIKSACITEVLETSTDPSAFAVYSKEVHSPNIVKYSEGAAVPTPLPRKLSSEASKPDWKKSPSKATPCSREEPTTFRALAERWQAITEGPGSSPSKPASPSGTLKKSEAPVPAVRRSIPDKSSQVESEYLDNKPSSRTSNNVLEIRKAFERVKGELETESNLNSVSPTGTSDELDSSSSKNLVGCPHSIFTPIPFSSYSTSSYHARMSSLDSNASEDNSLSLTGSLGHYGIGVRDNYGSITSLASSTSLISPQELQQLIEEANQSLEESGTPSHEIVVVVLHRGEAGPASLGLGITLAGGADYETKEITVHKVIAGSVADKDGRIQKGDRVLSINGKSLKGVTHREALSILKAPRPEVVLVLSRNRSVTPQEGTNEDRETATVQININCRLNSHVTSNRPPRILESPLDNPIVDNDERRGPTTTITLIKDGAGLGFSLEGGRDSPLGDRPLTVKKIFTGGSASKNGVLQVGDEIIGFNGCDVTGMSRIEAWNFMKKLPDGPVTLVIRQNQL